MAGISRARFVVAGIRLMLAAMLGAWRLRQSNG